MLIPKMVETFSHSHVLKVVPRCGSVSAIMDADSVYEAIVAAATAYSDALVSLVMRSHVSLVFTLLLLAATFAFAKGGEYAASKASKLVVERGQYPGWE